MNTISTATRAHDLGLPSNFDLQTELGQTKHLGGLRATGELVSLCQVTADKTFLNVGCGAGVAAAYLAQTVRCRVVAVDILPKMAWNFTWRMPKTFPLMITSLMSLFVNLSTRLCQIELKLRLNMCA